MYNAECSCPMDSGHHPVAIDQLPGITPPTHNGKGFTLASHPPPRPTTTTISERKKCRHFFGFYNIWQIMKYMYFFFVCCLDYRVFLGCLSPFPCVSYWGISNKDHQRMMVDPMFMIIQSLRSFLTAVITTAVAPFAAIPTCIYLNIPKVTWIYLNYLNLHEFTWIY